MTARVIVGMSILEANQADDLRQVADERGDHHAFLQLADPPLTHVLTELAAAGAEVIELVGVADGRLAPGNSWLRRVAGHWWRGYAEDAPRLEVATKLVGPDFAVPGVIDAALSVTRAITGREAGLTSPGWEEVPPYRHHVLFCRGPRCSARGADRALEALRSRVRADGIEDDRALVSATGCLFPCNHAPVVAVQPDDVWYGGIDENEVQQLVDTHLIGGEPLTARRLR
jgi:(2Fe-2S) ferredoxin